jgi:hypothetical protein
MADYKNRRQSTNVEDRRNDPPGAQRLSKAPGDATFRGNMTGRVMSYDTGSSLEGLRMDETLPGGSGPPMVSQLSQGGNQPPPSPDMEAFRAAADLAADQEAARLQGEGQVRREGKGVLEKAGDAALSVGTGVWKGLFETKDFFTGNTPDEDKSDFRKAMERTSQELGQESAVNSITEGISQFAVGILGASKLGAIARLPSLFGKVRGGKAALGIGEAAVGGAIVFDPYQARLSNLVQDFPALQNPVTAFLQADPANTEAENRFRSALESVGLDLAVIGVFLGSLKALRAGTRGDQKSVEDALAEASAALEQSRAEQIVKDAQVPPPAAPGTAKAPAASAGTTKDAPGPAGGGTPADPELERRIQERIDQGMTPEEIEADLDGRIGLDEIKQRMTPRPFDEANPPPQGEPITPAAPPVKTMADVANILRPKAPELNAAGQPVPEITVRPVGSQKPRPGAPVPKPGAPEPVVASGQVARTTPAADELPNVDSPGRVAADRPRPIPEIEDFATPPVLRAIARDVQALTQYGSRPAAIAAGHKFGGTVADQMVGKVKGLPWQTLDPEQVETIAARLADALAADITKTKGGKVISDQRLLRLAGQRAFLFNDNPAEVLGNIQAAGRNSIQMAANFEAATGLGIKMVDEVNQVAQHIQAGNFAPWGGNKAVALADFGKRAGLAIEFLANAKAMSSSAGRTLRRQRGDLNRLSLAQLKKMGDLPVETLLKLVQSANGDLRGVARVLQKPTWAARAVDALNYLRVNNLLWGWKTHVVNTVSNAYMLATRPLEKALGATIGRGINALTRGRALSSFNAQGARSMRVQAIREYRYAGAALVDAFKSASQAAIHGDSILDPRMSEAFRPGGAVTDQTGRVVGPTNQGQLMWRPVHGLTDVINNAFRAVEVSIGLPTRFLGFSDEATKQIAYRSTVMSDASLEADAMGLSGRAYKEHINRRLAEAFDEDGQAVNKAALEEARIRSFQQDLLEETAGKSIAMFRARHPLFGLVLPFVKTPVNVLRYGVKLTPGLNLLQKEYRRALAGHLGPDAQAHAIGQMSLGTLFMGTAAYLSSSGMFTGSGPYQPKTRSALMSAGWQPNSVRTIDEEGNINHFPLGRFDPVALPFSIVADLQDVLHAEGGETPQWQDAVFALGLALSNQLKNRTYLMSLNQFMEATMDPGEEGTNIGKYAGNLVGSMVPYSSLWKMTNSDPYMREVRDMVDGVMANTPGLSDKLRARRDWVGDEVSVRKGFTNTLEDNVVDHELVRMGLDTGNAPAPPSPLTKGGVDLRDFTLEDGRNAYDVLQELAGHPEGQPTLKDSLAKLIMSPEYQRAIDGQSDTKGTKQWFLKQITDKYRQAAKQKLLKMSPKLRAEVQAEELKARSAQKTGPVAPKTAGNMKVIQDLAKSYGVEIPGTVEDAIKSIAPGTQP